MRRLLALAVIAVVLIVPGAAASLVGISRFRTQETAHIRNGIVEAWSMRIILLHNMQTIGSGIVVCAAINNQKQCDGTFILPSGRVAVSGTFTARDRIVFVVTGGTGAYAGVKGVAISTQFECCPRQAFLTFYFI